ncbi:MAG TPA: class I SAM-dependent methyltransferase [Candidatus Binatia bacterium]|jgi:hypothetical protein
MFATAHVLTANHLFAGAHLLGRAHALTSGHALTTAGLLANARWLAARWHAAPIFLAYSILFSSFAPGMRLGKLRHALHRILERLYDWRFGIFSHMEVYINEFGVTDTACHDYAASSYLRFRQLMKLITIRAGMDVFLDFGSGMGRAVVLASTYPFRKVIGVELVRDLHSIAQENVQRARPRLRCRDIELHNVDARAFRIPPEVTVVYFWNPFSQHVLAQVFANIRQSIVESPRQVTILYLSPANPTELDNIQDGLQWLRERERVRLGSQSLGVIYDCGPAT